MLFKLSLKNISKSIKDYAIYFFTLILGVAIFYVFNAIDDQSVMMKVSSTTAEIIKLMTNVLSGVSVFVSIILAFLIVYASRFLINLPCSIPKPAIWIISAWRFWCGSCAI